MPTDIQEQIERRRERHHEVPYFSSEGRGCIDPLYRVDND